MAYKSASQRVQRESDVCKWSRCVTMGLEPLIARLLSDAQAPTSIRSDPPSLTPSEYGAACPARKPDQLADHKHRTNSRAHSALPNSPSSANPTPLISTLRPTHCLHQRTDRLFFQDEVDTMKSEGKPRRNRSGRRCRTRIRGNRSPTWIYMKTKIY